MGSGQSGLFAFLLIAISADFDAIFVPAMLNLNSLFGENLMPLMALQDDKVICMIWVI